ncbi:MAG: V-type ATP synthase subunit K, partial [Firmicutes bacterium]|nr:V-type ATP synthase subunit K [Bacillota bacterium]
TGVSAMSAVGAWKRSFLQNKPAPFLLVALTGFPLSQTFYGLILMNTTVQNMVGLDSGLILGIGLFGGLAIGASAWLQGKAAAVACDAYGETGKGFAQYVLVLGIIESVGLLGMVFLMNITSALAG